MAYQGVTTAALALALATGAGAGASAQSIEQLQNRYQLQESRRQMDQSAFERRVEQDAVSRQLGDRVERQAIERRLSTPRLRPPAGTLRRY